MRFALTAGVILFVAFQAPAGGQETPAREGVAEPAMESVIAGFFVGYGPMPIGELSAETRARTVGDPAYDHPDRSPTAIRADLDGNGFDDYALLIRKTAGPDIDEIFVVLMAHGEGRFSKAMESFFGSIAADTYLGYLQPGEVLATAAGVPPLQPTYPAVVLHVGGQPAFVVRWDSDRSALRVVGVTAR